ncbi:helix-turn-helix domain-containing protein [Mycolicibacterium fortuitum]|uniref:helix-turn-helix domain-containing protein n=1 Tax=Mycolicibacterium fortuitum TaxID=1766 RepID=UPI003AAB3A14
MNREAAGAAIRALRESRELSLEEVAASSGVSAMGLSYLERGIRKPRKDTIRKVEMGLGLPSGTYERLKVADDPNAELKQILSVASEQAAATRTNPTVGGGLVVGRRSETSALIEGYAEAQIDAINAVITRLPSETAPDYESYIAFVIDRCIQAEGLAADSWRVAAHSDPGDADRLMGHLQTLEATRQSLVSRLESRSLGAQFNSACTASSLSDTVIARMLGTTAENVWAWRNETAIPGDSVELIQTFIATTKDRAKDDEPR